MSAGEAETKEILKNKNKHSNPPQIAAKINIDAPFKC